MFNEENRTRELYLWLRDPDEIAREGFVSEGPNPYPKGSADYENWEKGNQISHPTSSAGNGQ